LRELDTMGGGKGRGVRGETTGHSADREWEGKGVQYNGTKNVYSPEREIIKERERGSQGVYKGGGA